MEQTERRETTRYLLELPIAFSRVPTIKPNAIFQGETRNISTRGICFTTNQTVSVNEVIDFSLKFPAVVGASDLSVSGRGKILRVIPQAETASEAISVAVAIVDFRILKTES